jgi:hypothetical protein
VLAFSLPIQSIHNLVIGENTTAFAAGGLSSTPNGRLLSFDMSAGTVNWTYDSTFGGSAGSWVDTVAAAPDNSLRATEGFYKEARVAFTLDANGLRTDDPVSGDQITFLTSAGVNSQTWLGADQTALAFVGGFDPLFSVSAVMQSGMSIGTPGMTAIVSSVLHRVQSSFMTTAADRSEGPMHSFGLFWCGDPEPCTTNWTAIQWLYAQSGHSSNINDFSKSHPEWTATIKAEAMKAFQRAYIPYGISVEIGRRHAHSSDPNDLVRDQEFGAYVVGDLTPPGTGQSFTEIHSSKVFYWAVMIGAQEALGHVDSFGSWVDLNLTYPPATASDKAAFMNLMRAIGKGIGDAATHEMGHQLERYMLNGVGFFPFMDCGDKYYCENGDNYVYNFFNGDGFPNDSLNSIGGQFFYIDVPKHLPIHWQTSNDCWLQMYGRGTTTCVKNK